MLRPGVEEEGVRGATFCVRPWLWVGDGAGEPAGLEVAFFPETLEGGPHSLLRFCHMNVSACAKAKFRNDKRYQLSLKIKAA